MTERLRVFVSSVQKEMEDERLVVQQLNEIGVGTKEDPVFWFDTTGFAVSPANERRANPWMYDSLTGPAFKNVDISLSKRFKLNDRVKFEVRMDCFNALNMMNYQDPQLDESKSDFGQVSAQIRGYFGRQFQYSARFEF